MIPNVKVKYLKRLLLSTIIILMVFFTSCLDSKNSTNQTEDIPTIVNQIKEQIAKQGHVSDQEDNALILLKKVVHGKEFDPTLVEKVQDLIAQDNKTKLEQNISNLLDAIQIKGNISDKDEEAIKDLLALTVGNS
ncbi:hypothetical protein [Olleya aquimaris]|uniref:Lipoprotein n=1 Tax=Olleya aquimaris TaxID=639310 RepID=A0A327RNS6_9FLAO|nr:hypothetical protein [Olleya aquimaris]RAJ18151.1 hypothetical protein LY08_00425 [Olleya aquimaris]